MRFGFDTPLPITSNLLPPDSPTSTGSRHRLSSNLLPKLLLLVLAINAAYFMAFLPFPPKFSLISAEFRLHSLTATQISGEWNVTFSFANPSNETCYEFRNIAVAVFSADGGRRERLAESHIARPITPETVDGVEVQARLLSPAQYLNGDVLRGVLVDRGDGFARFDLEVEVDSVYERVLLGPLVNRRKAICSGVRFEFGGEGEGNYGIAKIENVTCIFGF